MANRTIIKKIKIGTTEYDLRDVTAITSVSINGKVITFSSSEGTVATITIPDSDSNIEWSSWDN
jgi:hypothetical protein